MTFQPPKGTDDILAPRSQMWRDALRSWETHAERYGYPLVSTPIFEATELFERGVGDSTEVVTKQMYTFTDRGGRSLTLRPEGTAGVVRAYLESGHQGLWKGAYSGPFFRYEQPQAGRRRQFWQVGVEYLGTASALADVEVIELGYRYVNSLGVSGLVLALNSIGDSECRPGYVEELRGHLRAIEADLSPEAAALIDRNPLRVLDSKIDRERLSEAPRSLDYLCDACREHHEAVKENLTRLDVPFEEDSNLVRGLDYYTRTAFEYVATDLDAAQNAIGGGGRYDGLAEAIGGPPTPGVGLAMGLDRIVSTVAQNGRGHLDAFLVSETGAEDGLRIASRLRAEGVRLDVDVEGRSVKAQFRAARRLGAPVIVVWKGDGHLVDVQTESERAELPLQEVSNWLKG